jgi:hypothetical protein
MLGCGYDQDDDNDDDEIVDGGGGGHQERFALGEVSPWFWLHNIENVPGSYRLEGAAGPLYMGGHLEEAAERMAQHSDVGSSASSKRNLDDDAATATTAAAAGRIKFFRQYRIWSPGELQRELDDGKWIPCRQDPHQALQVVMPRIVLPTKL